jgi:hypothetical protein
MEAEYGDSGAAPKGDQWQEGKRVEQAIASRKTLQSVLTPEEP